MITLLRRINCSQPFFLEQQATNILSPLSIGHGKIILSFCATVRVTHVLHRQIPEYQEALGNLLRVTTENGTAQTIV